MFWDKIPSGIWSAVISWFNNIQLHHSQQSQQKCQCPDAEWSLEILMVDCYFLAESSREMKICNSQVKEWDFTPGFSLSITFTFSSTSFNTLIPHQVAIVDRFSDSSWTPSSIMSFSHLTLACLGAQLLNAINTTLYSTFSNNHWSTLIDATFISRFFFDQPKE